MNKILFENNENRNGYKAVKMFDGVNLNRNLAGLLDQPDDSVDEIVSSILIGSTSADRNILYTVLSKLTKIIKQSGSIKLSFIDPVNLAYLIDTAQIIPEQMHQIIFINGPTGSFISLNNLKSLINKLPLTINYIANSGIWTTIELKRNI